MFRPTTVAHAIALAKLQENHLKMLEGKVQQCLEVEMRPDENEDIFLEKVWSKEEPANEVCAGGSIANDENDVCVASSKILESATIGAIGIENQNEAIVSELGQVNGAMSNSVGICNTSKISKDFTVENRVGQALECLQIDQSIADSKEFDFEIPYVEHLKLINEEVEDPFYDSINSVRLNEKIQLLLAMGMDKSMVEMVFVCSWVCGMYESYSMMVMRFQVMYVAGIGAQWLRKGVG